MFPVKARTIENIIVIIFEISFIALAIQAVNINDDPRMKIALMAFFITLIPYIVEKLLGITLPFGVKIMIPFALFMHTAGGIMRWYWIYSGFYYDKIAHIIAALGLGLVIFCSFLTYILYSKREITKRSVLIWTALITFLFGIFWECMEAYFDSILLTSYNGGIGDSIGDTMGDIIGIIICLYIIKRWMDAVPPQKSISSLLRKDQSPAENTQSV